MKIVIIIITLQTRPNLRHMKRVCGLGTVSDGEETITLAVGEQAARRRTERFHGPATQKIVGTQHLQNLSFDLLQLTELF